jgi:hypothetical protein
VTALRAAQTQGQVGGQVEKWAATSPANTYIVPRAMW